jgi:hypothetical protein
MPPILGYLLRLLPSAALFGVAFRLFVAPIDHLWLGRGRGAGGQARSAAAPLAFLVRLVLAVVYASYVAALVTHWTHRPDVTYDWFYYLLAGSLYFGPFVLMGKSAEVPWAILVTAAGGAALLVFCLMPGANLTLFGGIWMGIVDGR